MIKIYKQDVDSTAKKNTEILTKMFILIQKHKIIQIHEIDSEVSSLSLKCRKPLGDNISKQL